MPVFLSSLVIQLGNNLLAMPETWVQSLGGEDPLEKEKATHYSILAWRIPWTQSMGSQRIGQDWATFTFTFIYRKKRKLHSLRLAKGTFVTHLKACSFSPFQRGFREKQRNKRSLWDLFWHFLHPFTYSCTQQYILSINHRLEKKKP